MPPTPHDAREVEPGHIRTMGRAHKEVPDDADEDVAQHTETATAHRCARGQANDQPGNDTHNLPPPRKIDLPQGWENQCRLIRTI